METFIIVGLLGCLGFSLWSFFKLNKDVKDSEEVLVALHNLKRSVEILETSINAIQATTEQKKKGSVVRQTDTALYEQEIDGEKKKKPKVPAQALDQ